jgi:superfamily II DNA/RNA helicase
MAFSNYGARPSSSQRGGQRSFGSRPQGGRPQGGRGGFRSQQRGPKPAYIHPSKYINRAVALEVQEAYVPTNSFADFNLHPQLLHNVTAHGYTQPTPIQDQSIPTIMAGKDLVGLANTGTGKTAAFLLPIIHTIAHDPQAGALIVVPTRELAQQISEECAALVRGLPIGYVLCVGGVSIEPQMRTLSRNPHIVIGTPGRLKDLIDRRALDLAMFRNIVLDEVDRMLDIGFIKDIQYLISFLPKERRSMFFSATLTPATTAIMQSFLQDPVMVSVKTHETAAQIDQDVVYIERGMNKVEILYDMLRNPEFERVIVFGRTKHGINKLEEILADRGMRVGAIHGNKTQGARQRALDSFKHGYTKVLLATDVAARGIDINDVTHVINFDEPNTYDDYVHRIGRTGRAGKVGKALTFVG